MFAFYVSVSRVTLRACFLNAGLIKANLAAAGNGGERNAYLPRTHRPQHRPTHSLGGIPEISAKVEGGADPEVELQHQIRNGTLFGIGLLGGLGGFDDYDIGAPYQPSPSSDTADTATADTADTAPAAASAGEEAGGDDDEAGGPAEFEGSELGKSENEGEGWVHDEAGEDDEGVDEDGDGEGWDGGGGSDGNSDANGAAGMAAENGDGGEADDEKHGGIVDKETVSKLFLAGRADALLNRCMPFPPTSAFFLHP